MKTEPVPLLERFVPPKTSKALNQNVTQALEMVNKKLVAFASIVFVVGLVLGTVALRPDFSSNQYKTYPIQAEIVHAYFKTYNTSADSGLSNTMMVSYVFVLNVTNLSDTKLSISQVLLDCANLFHYTLDYRQGSNDYWFYPHTSRLIAVSQTSGLNSLGLEMLESKGGPVFILAVGLSPSEGRGGGSSAFAASTAPTQSQCRRVRLWLNLQGGFILLI